MIVRFLKKAEFRGKEYKKGDEVIMTKADATKYCQEELAVANVDIPCPERNSGKKNAKTTTRKRKSSSNK